MRLSRTSVISQRRVEDGVDINRAAGIADDIAVGGVSALVNEPASSRRVANQVERAGRIHCAFDVVCSRAGTDEVTRDDGVLESNRSVGIIYAAGNAAYAPAVGIRAVLRNRDVR